MLNCVLFVYSHGIPKEWSFSGKDTLDFEFVALQAKAFEIGLSQLNTHLPIIKQSIVTPIMELTNNTVIPSSRQSAAEAGDISVFAKRCSTPVVTINDSSLDTFIAVSKFIRGSELQQSVDSRWCPKIVGVLFNFDDLVSYYTQSLGIQTPDNINYIAAGLHCKSIIDLLTKDILQVNNTSLTGNLLEIFPIKVYENIKEATDGYDRWLNKSTLSDNYFKVIEKSGSKDLHNDFVSRAFGGTITLTNVSVNMAYASALYPKDFLQKGFMAVPFDFEDAAYYYDYFGILARLDTQEQAHNTETKRLEKECLEKKHADQEKRDRAKAEYEQALAEYKQMLSEEINSMQASLSQVRMEVIDLTTEKAELYNEVQNLHGDIARQKAEVSKFTQDKESVADEANSKPDRKYIVLLTAVVSVFVIVVIVAVFGWFHISRLTDLNMDMSTVISNLERDMQNKDDRIAELEGKLQAKEVTTDSRTETSTIEVDTPTGATSTLETPEQMAAIHYVTVQDLTVRSLPTTDDTRNRIGSLMKDDKVAVLGYETEYDIKWAKILFNGDIAYVSAEYLSEEPVTLDAGKEEN